MGFVQALGVLIDTVVICSCTAFLMLLVPQDLTAGLSGMDLLQTAMQYHLGGFGTVFIAATLALFSFSTFLGCCITPAATWPICAETTGGARPCTS